MDINGFGEFFYINDNYHPEGLVLREKAEGIVLEKYFDTEGKNVDVLQTFDSWMTLADKECLEACLRMARKYEPDMFVPIYIKHFSKEASEESIAVQRGEVRRTCFGCSEHLARKLPWETIDWDKCKKCNIQTKSAE